jgi:DNA-directed RNA polymerase subunit L
MAIQMADVTIHIDETLDHTHLEKLRETMLAEAGVMAAVYHDEKPHLMIVEYDPVKNSSGNLLKVVETQGVHAELIGL